MPSKPSTTLSMIEERYCILRSTGVSQSKAYAQARVVDPNKKYKDMTPECAGLMGHRLEKKPMVKAKIQEIKDKELAKYRENAFKFIEEKYLEAIQKVKQFKGRDHLKALECLAKLGGLLKDEHNHHHEGNININNHFE